MKNVQYVLKNEMKIPENDKKRIRELNNLFIENDMPYLNGKTLPQKIKNELTDLYLKYIHRVYENLSWGYDFVKMEKRAEKSKNTNETYFIMSYILSWATDFKDTVNIDDIFRALSTREIFVIMFKNAYERIEK
jgi:hypothetical protein